MITLLYFTAKLRIKSEKVFYISFIFQLALHLYRINQNLYPATFIEKVEHNFTETSANPTGLIKKTHIHYVF